MNRQGCAHTHLLVLVREAEGEVEEELGCRHHHRTVGMVQAKVQHLQKAQRRCKPRPQWTSCQLQQLLVMAG